MKNKIPVLISSFVAFMTMGSYALAQTVTDGLSCDPRAVHNIKDLIMNLVIGCVLARLVYLIMAIAVVAFMFGVFRFMRAEGDGRQQGKELMFWGIIGLFVMVSLWGLVAILQGTFGTAGVTDITPRNVTIPKL
ncbi:MAG: hypothetical protein WCX27_01130 [Candidatus Paceibacterota bacterium]|jgi:hypothetical protein